MKHYLGTLDAAKERGITGIADSTIVQSVHNMVKGLPDDRVNRQVREVLGEPDIVISRGSQKIYGWDVDHTERG